MTAAAAAEGTAAAAGVAAAAAADRRESHRKTKPPGTKTARHGRTNRLQNRTDKVPKHIIELKTGTDETDTRRVLPLVVVLLLKLTEQ